MLKEHYKSVKCLVELPNGYLAAGSGDSVKMWDLKDTGRSKQTLCKHDERVESLVVLPNRDLASGSEDKTIMGLV